MGKIRVQKRKGIFEIFSSDRTPSSSFFIDQDGKTQKLSYESKITENTELNLKSPSNQIYTKIFLNRKITTDIDLLFLYKGELPKMTQISHKSMFQIQGI